MTRYLLDTCVLVYARGREHPLREPCRAAIRAAAAGRITLEASVEVMQEYAHLLLRRATDRTAALAEVDEVRSLCRLHPFGVDVLTEARGLLQRHPALGVRDAVHAATALHAGIGRVLSADRAFDALEGLRRVDPAQPGTAWAQLER